jgi:sec-independent protein translocase protein TatC
MSVTGVIGLFRANPQNPIGADGRMALADHLRELRARLLRVVLVLVVAVVVALFFYDQLLELVLSPYNQARVALDQKTQTTAYVAGATGPLMLQLKLCGVAAIVVSSPYWLAQIWGFVVPGLHANERRWSRVFAAIAGPLFMIGVVTGYYVLPKGLEVLIGFTPAQLQSLVEFGEYFSFLTRMLLVFGIAFEIPLFVVMLNLAGVVSGRTLGAYRPWIVVGTFVFAAVATPSTDPFSMLMLAVPMLVLFLISELIARLVDRRRGRRSLDDLPDDQASSLERDPGSDDVRRSGLDEDED